MFLISTMMLPIFKPWIGPPSREILPVPIDTNLPHIPFQIGQDADSDESPALLGVYDTAASLSTGNMFYVTKVAKMFPGTVAAVYTSDKFALLHFLVWCDVTMVKRPLLSFQWRLSFTPHT